MAMIQSSILLVYKHTVYPIDYTNCKTAHDMRHLVEATTKIPEFFDLSSGLEYVVSVEAAGDETSVSLNGDRYNPEAKLPSLDNVAFLDLCGSPIREYETQIHGPGLQPPFTENNTLKFRMNYRTTVHELKDNIRRATGIALNSRLLEF